MDNRSVGVKARTPLMVKPPQLLVIDRLFVGAG
jgi:hypothetical protein